MVSAREGLSSGRLVASALRDLVRPPFVTLLALDLLASLASVTIGADDIAIVAVLVLLTISLYLTIAVVLAAGAEGPEPSADAWIRAALRRRCFWRLLLASLFTIVLIVLGSLGLIVGGIIVAGYVGLAQAAAVLERTGPTESLRRSFELSRPARAPVAVIASACILVPTVVLQVGAELDWDDALGWAWIAIVIASRIISIVGDIALARAFVALGGAPTPSMSELRPPREERSYGP